MSLNFEKWLEEWLKTEGLEYSSIRYRRDIPAVGMDEFSKHISIGKRPFSVSIAPSAIWQAGSAGHLVSFGAEGEEKWVIPLGTLLLKIFYEAKMQVYGPITSSCDQGLSYVAHLDDSVFMRWHILRGGPIYKALIGGKGTARVVNISETDLSVFLNKVIVAVRETWSLTT